MIEESFKYITIAVGVLLLPLSWLYVRSQLVEAPHEIDQVIRDNSAAQVCLASNPCNVSVNELLRNPNTFDASFVQSSGVLRLEFESYAIYATESDYLERRNDRSLWLNLESAQVDAALKSGSSALVIGKFHGKRNFGAQRVYGHDSSWPAEITVIHIRHDGS